MSWSVEKIKGGCEIWASSKSEAIFVGDGYENKERKRSIQLAEIIVKALNENDK
jgi:hypothetical protein